MVRHDSQELLNCLTEEISSPPIDINDEIQRILWIYLTVRSTQGDTQDNNYVCVVEDYAKILRYGFELNKYYQSDLSNSNRPSGYTLSESSRNLLKTESTIASGITTLKNVFESVFDAFVPKSNTSATVSASFCECSQPTQESAHTTGESASNENSTVNHEESEHTTTTEESEHTSTEESEHTTTEEGASHSTATEENSPSRKSEKKTDFDDILAGVGEIFGKATKVASYFDKIKEIIEVINKK